MKRFYAIAIGALLCVSACSKEKTLPFRGESGEVIYVSNHKVCRWDSDGSNYISAHHYKSGRMYGIKLMTGQLVPPGTKGRPDRDEIVWMCRYHVAEWIGTDPETGKRAEWMPKRITNAE